MNLIIVGLIIALSLHLVGSIFYVVALVNRWGCGYRKFRLILYGLTVSLTLGWGTWILGVLSILGVIE